MKSNIFCCLLKKTVINSNYLHCLERQTLTSVTLQRDNLVSDVLQLITWLQEVPLISKYCLLNKSQRKPKELSQDLSQWWRLLYCCLLSFWDVSILFWSHDSLFKTHFFPSTALLMICFSFLNQFFLFLKSMYWHIVWYDSYPIHIFINKEQSVLLKS